MTPTSPRYHRLLAVGAAAAALFAGLALGGCSTGAAAAPAAEAAPLAVTTAPVALTDVATAIEAGGIVQARTTATIAARILAPVRDIRVAPGDRVRAGQPLIVLAGEDLVAAARAVRAAARAAEQGSEAAAAELRAAEAGLVLARASHDRIAGLQAKRSATPQELDEATAALRSAEARVTGAAARAQQAAAAVESARAASDQASTTGSFTTLAAPFDGTVTEKLVEPGNMALPGAPLLRLEDTRGFRLEVRLDESRVAQIREGDRVPVVLGTGTAAVAGTVTEISRAVDADARASLVKIALPEVGGLRSGVFGRARLSGPRRRALTVPGAAVVRRGQLASVFVVDGGLARLRLVDLRDTEVVAGLVASERVVVSPPAGLSDGRRVVEGGRP